MDSPVRRAREASATPSGGRLGWWARVAVLGVVVALLGVGGGRAAPTTTATLPPFVEAGRLVAFDGDRAERFGFAVALDGNTLAVGSRNAKVGSHGDQGAVYVYVRSGNAWVLQQKLTADDGAANDHFGYAVALRGNVLVAGAPYHKVGSHQDQGAAYVFRRSGTTWTPETQIVAPGGVNGERFGWSLALSGSTLAVGVPYDSRGEGDAGAVQVFTHAGSSWSQQARLTASDAARADNFGFSVALDGGKLLAGAPYRDGTGDDEGAVYAFARSGAIWSVGERLTAATPVAEDHFGTAVALHGLDAVVGAPGRDGARRDQGAAYTYAYAAAGWVRGQTLTVPAGAEENDAEFGAAVALDAGTLAAGAPENPASASNQGLVYTFSGGDGAWAPRQTLTVPEAARGAHVGAAVAVSGAAVVAGAPDDDIPQPDKHENDTQGSVTAFAEFAAADDAYTTDQGAPLSVPAPGVLANDANPNGGTLSAQLASGPANGTVTLNADGSFTYTPAAGFSGADGFSYHAQLGGILSNLANVTITVRPRPTASPDSYSTRQDTPLTVTAPGVLANDTSGSGGSLTARLVGGPAHGTVTLNADGSFTYTPDAGFVGSDAFTYTASDGVLESLPATVFLTVTPKPPPPTANHDAYSTVQDTPLTVTAPGVLANDDGGSGGALTAALFGGGPAHGTLALNADGSFLYTPTLGFNGDDAFSYTATNSAGSAQTTVSLTVKPPQPIANADNYSTRQDTPLTVSAPGVLGNDSPAGLTASVVTPPEHGTLALNADGSFLYTPTPGFNGDDEFTYHATNSAGSSLATATLAVLPPPLLPIANPDAYSTVQDTPLTVTAPGVLANDDGGSGGALTAALFGGGPAHGTLALNADGSFLYTPTLGFNGDDAFSYTATNSAGSAQTTVSLTVKPPQPIANADNYSTRQDTPLTVSAPGVLGNDSPAGLTASVVTPPEHGTLALNADGSFLYTPTPGFNGDDEFTYHATNSAGSSLATATLAVLPPPLLPIANPDAYSTVQDTPLTVDAATGVLANDTGAVTAAVVTGPAHGTLTLQADGSFTYAPAAGYAGPDTFSYDARNPAGADRADVALVVHPKPNHPPAAGDDAFTTLQDTPLVITAAQVLANDSDPDGDALAFASPLPLTNPDHGRLTVSTGGATYTPDPGFSGTDTFTYAVSDGRDSSPPAKVTITVTPAGPPDVDGGGEVIIVPSPPTGGGVPPGPAVPVIPGRGLRICAVRVETAAGAPNALLLAHGSVKLKSTRRVAVRTRLTRDGLRVLSHTVGGVTVKVRAICRTGQGEIRGDFARQVALLRVERTVTPPGSWVPDRAVLTPFGERFVRALARRLRPLTVARLRCDGHTAIAPASIVDPETLSRERAQLVCGRLRPKSLSARRRIVAHGGSVPIATNATEAGRAANRRAAVTIVYRRARNGRASRAGSGVPLRPWSPPAAPAVPRGRSPQGA